MSTVVAVVAGLAAVALFALAAGELEAESAMFLLLSGSALLVICSTLVVLRMLERRRPE